MFTVFLISDLITKKLINTMVQEDRGCLGAVVSAEAQVQQVSTEGTVRTAKTEVTATMPVTLMCMPICITIQSFKLSL